MTEKDQGPNPEAGSLKGTLTFIAIGLLATALLGGGKLLFERSSFGHSAELFAFELLQGQLPYFDPKNPVVVLDTSDLPRDAVASRERLEEIIGALAEQGPLAIGVDWEFSPKESEYASTRDPHFFNFCLEIKRKKGIPIFLGVNRRKGAPPGAWLGDERYRELAAAVGARKEDTSRLPIWIQRKGVDGRLPLLGYALANAYSEKRNSKPPEPPSWIRWALRRGAEVPRDFDFVYEDRLVNYSNLEAMRLAAQRDLSQTSVAESGRRSYEGKIVILGDASEGSSHDQFDVPGVPGVSGVLLHASAAYTFAKAPLFEFKHSVRLLLDVLLAAVIVVAVAVFRHRHAGERDFSLRRRQTKFIWAATAGVVVTGWLLVLFTRVMWLDFLMVVAALFLHPRLEGRIHRLQERRRRTPADHAAAGAGAGATALVFFGALLLAPAARAQEAALFCQERVAAVIIGVKEKGAEKEKGGPRARRRRQPVACYFRESDAADWQPLTAADYKRKQLLPSQELSCEKDCVLTIFLCGTRKEYEVRHVKPDKYVVIHAFESLPLNDPFESPAARPGTSRISAPKNPETMNHTRALLAGAQTRPRITGGLPPALGTVTPPKEKKEVDPPATRGGWHGTREAGAKKEVNVPAGVAVRGVIPAGRPAPAGDWRAEMMARAEREERYVGELTAANAARDAKDFATALKHYTQAVETLEGDARAHLGIGNVYADQGEWEEALKAYRRAAQINPLHSTVHFALGLALLRSQRGAPSKETMDAVENNTWLAIKLSPWSEGAPLDLLDELLEKRGASVGEAESFYRRAITLAPWSAEAHLRLGRLLLKQSKTSEADGHLLRAGEMAYEPETLRNVARTYEERGLSKEAERPLRRAFSLYPRDVQTLYGLGRVLLLRNQPAQAVQPLTRAAELGPKEFAPRFLLGLAYLRSGRLPDAERVFGEAASVASSKSERLGVAYGLGRVGDAHSKARRLSEAVRVYERALRVDPDDADVKNRLAKARARVKR